MSIKFSRLLADNTALSIADGAHLNFPANGDFAVAFTIVMDGVMTTAAGSGAYQTVFRTGGYQDAGNLVAMWTPTDSGTTSAGKFYFQMGGSTTNRCHIGPVEAGKAYLVVIQRSSGGVNSKLCPILTSAPVDGSAVTSGTSFSFTDALDGPDGLILGWHSTNGRRLDHSLERFFRVDRALTDLEIANLAYGKEITQYATPTWYIRMKDTTDVSDTGSQANVVTATGTLTNGTSAGYGFSSVASAPVFSSAPIVNGSPVVGTASTYTAGQVTGNPSPTVTQQWTINGVDIAGATGATYTPVSGDATKLLRVRQIATNSQGTTSSTSDGVVVSSTAVGLTVVQPTAERFYQRVGTTAPVALSGTYTGTAPTTIEYQLYAPDGTTIMQAWTNLSATISGGNWNATPSMPVPSNRKKYRLAVRSKNSGGNVISTTTVGANKFAIGDIIGVVGSSSPAAWFTNGSGTGKVAEHESVSVYDSAWALFGTDGQASQMAGYISQALDVPVAFVPTALGGTSLSDWQDNTSTTWARFTTALTSVGGKMAGVFISCGSNDITSSAAALTVSAHLTKMRNLIANIRSATGNANLPILWSGINRRTDALTLQANNARSAENLIGDDANVSHVQTLDLELGGDGVHLTGPGYAVCCRRMEYVWSQARLGTNRRGPKITSITYNGSGVGVQIAHRNGTDYSPTTSITGFTIKDDSGAAAVVSAVRTDATNISIVCDRTLVNPKVTYLEGAAPEVGTPVQDNGTVSLPMHMEVTLAAVQGSGGGIADTTDPVLPGTLSVTGVTSSGCTVSWSAASDNVGVTGYELSADIGTASYVAVGNVLSKAVTGLNPDTEYTIRVRAFDAANNKSVALTTTITTDAAPVVSYVAEIVKNSSAPISSTPTVIGTVATPVRYNEKLQQEIILYNKSASAVTVTVKGGSASIFEIPRAAGRTIDLSVGYSFTVNANSFSIFRLDKAKSYLKGNITITASANSAVSACLVS